MISIYLLKILSPNYLYRVKKKIILVNNFQSVRKMLKLFAYSMHYGSIS